MPRGRTRKRKASSSPRSPPSSPMTTRSKKKTNKMGCSSLSSAAVSRKKTNNKKSASFPLPILVEEIFLRIADADDPAVASMEGIGMLCEEFLGIDPLEDIRILVLLWKLGSKEKPAQISKAEWLSGCSELRVNRIDELKGLLPSLDTGFLDRTDFKDFYKFCFRFNLQGTCRRMDKDMAVALMKMVLHDQIPSDRLNTFCKFVETQKSYTQITLDQWTSFLDFCHECEDLKDYNDSTSAWPVLIDEYVDYVMEEK